ncbi:Holliday junction resolvase RuvX [Persicobacter psychrovividus]|uniref:Putative pre-16S rRNA nuclease n=1 Tax=Persicobacter psychrovividus TaxID=387638 RepID=A0ABM7VFH3_9BACT|nr:putative pre-16S rRNA nuclease [Persicobacter psychrovividus]
MGRIMAIDYGTKRVGIAVTDPMQIIASPLDTVHSKDIVDFIVNYAKTEELDCVVVGWPTKLDSSDTNNTQNVQAFVNRLKKMISLPIHLEDERFTSKIAMQAMISAGSKKKDRAKKGNIDKVSAAVILQSYMERTKGF